MFHICRSTRRNRKLEVDIKVENIYPTIKVNIPELFRDEDFIRTLLPLGWVF